MLPSRAEALLWPVAEQINQLGLVLLLVKYMLSPEQALTASVGEDGLHVEGFAEPLLLEPEDRPRVEEWLGRTKRSHSAQAVRNVLSAKLKPALVSALETHQECTDRRLDRLAHTAPVRCEGARPKRHRVERRGWRLRRVDAPRARAQQRRRRGRHLEDADQAGP